MGADSIEAEEAEQQWGEHGAFQSGGENGHHDGEGERAQRGGTPPHPAGEHPEPPEVAGEPGQADLDDQVQPERVHRFAVEPVKLKALRAKARVAVPLRVGLQRHDPAEGARPVTQHRTAGDEPEALLCIENPDFPLGTQVPARTSGDAVLPWLGRAADGQVRVRLGSLVLDGQAHRVHDAPHPALHLFAHPGGDRERRQRQHQQAREHGFDRQAPAGQDDGRSDGHAQQRLA